MSLDITTPTVLGIDCYHGDEIDSWHDLHAAGVRYAFLKATQGLDYDDPAYRDNYTRAKSVGILAGAYHFFDAITDPVQQARHFIRVAAPMKGDLLPALDVEVLGPNIGERARQCADEIKRLCGHCPIIYSDKSFFVDNLAAHFPEFTLWIADYTGTKMLPALPSGTAFWQNSSSAHLTGAPLPLDADVFMGSEADLQRYVIA